MSKFNSIFMSIKNNKDDIISYNRTGNNTTGNNFPHASSTRGQKSEPKMEQVLGLPAELFTTLLLEWIGMFHVVRLDTACCSKSCRQRLLQVMQSSEFILPRSAAVPKYDREYESYMRWLVLRRVKIMKLVVRESKNELLQKLCVLNGDTIRELRIERHLCEFAWNAGSIVAICRKLTVLEVSFCRNLCGFNDLLNSVSGTLQKLVIVHSDETWRYRASCNVLTELGTLSLTGQYSAETLYGLLLSAPNISAVLLYKTLADGRCLQQLRTTGHCLVHMTLDDLADIVDEDMLGLAGRCSSLESVRLARCRLLTDASVVAFATHCPHLMGIALRGPYSSVALSAIAQHCGARLQHLSICQMAKSIDEGLRELTSRCQQLKSFQYGRLGAYMSKTMKDFLSVQRGLQHLDISDSRFDQLVLEGIAAVGASLELLNLYDAVYLGSNHHLLALHDHCLQLRKVVLHDSRCPIVSPLARALWKRNRPRLEFVFADELLPFWQI
jgi:hypothetical protein